MIANLYADLKEVHAKLSRVTNERADALEKYAESEKYWRHKVHKLQ